MEKPRESGFYINTAWAETVDMKGEPSVVLGEMYGVVITLLAGDVQGRYISIYPADGVERKSLGIFTVGNGPL